MILSLALLASTALAGDGVSMKLITSGATAKSGGYSPIRAELTGASAAVKVAPKDLTAAKYGAFTFGAKSVAFILDEPTGKPARLFVDTNGDGDLTNDPAAEWAARAQGTATMYFGGANVDLGKGPMAIKMYRFDPADPQRAALKNTILYYADFGYEVTLTLDGKDFKSFVAGEPAEKVSLSVDRNNDGKISYKRENIRSGVPFNFTGTSYVLKSEKGSLSLAKADKAVDATPLPPNLEIGQKAIKFTSPTIDGGKVEFPGDYKGKLVMLDFWATWCGPCIAELPNVKKAYEKWHEQGFEILGISFDQPEMKDKVKGFVDSNGLPWRHIYEGKFWDTTLGGTYDVGAIPFVLLVDGDTGEILATAKELRGPGLTDFIEKALAKKKGNARR